MLPVLPPGNGNIADGGKGDLDEGVGVGVGEGKAGI